MTTTEYVIDGELDDTVKKIIAESTHPALNQIREQELIITPIMKVRTNDEGEHEQNSGPPTKIQKVSDMMRLFTKSHYFLIVDYYFFNHANCVDALIFDALCSIDVKSKDGAIKLATKKPDICVHAATLQVYGAFDDGLLGIREWMNTAKTKAAESFAKKVSSGNLESHNEEADPGHEEAAEQQAETQKPRGGRSKR